MLHFMKRNVRPQGACAIMLFDYYLICITVRYLKYLTFVSYRWHYKCIYLPQRKTPEDIQPGVEMGRMR